MGKTPAQKSVEVLVNLAENAQDEGVKLNAAVAILDRGSFIQDEHQQLLQFLMWMRENPHLGVTIRAYNSLDEVIVAYLSDDGEPEEGDR